MTHLSLLARLAVLFVCFGAFGWLFFARNASDEFRVLIWHGRIGWGTTASSGPELCSHLAELGGSPVPAFESAPAGVTVRRADKLWRRFENL